MLNPNLSKSFSSSTSLIGEIFLPILTQFDAVGLLDVETSFPQIELFSLERHAKSIFFASAKDTP